MQPASLKEIKQELKHLSQSKILELCLSLARFKKENKELLSYLLFEESDEAAYIEKIQLEIDQQFKNVNTKSYYFIRKSIRKILTTTKKHIRYSKKKETEIELLLYFCSKLKSFKPSINKSVRLQNIFDRQILLIKKAVSSLHEDLQYDYNLEIEKIDS